MPRQPFDLDLSGLLGAQPPELLVRDMRHFTFSWKKSLGPRFSQLQNKSLYTVLLEEEEGKSLCPSPVSMALLLLQAVRVRTRPQVGGWGCRLEAVRVQATPQVGVRGCLLLAVGVSPHEDLFMTRKSAGEEEREE